MMFSGDISFDADDEAFLQAALNIERVENESQNDPSTDELVLVSAKRKSFDMSCSMCSPPSKNTTAKQTTESANSTSNAKAFGEIRKIPQQQISTHDTSDPLGLNRCLLKVNEKKDIVKINHAKTQQGAVKTFVESSRNTKSEVSKPHWHSSEKSTTKRFKFNASNSPAVGLKSFNAFGGSDSCVDGANAFPEVCDRQFATELCDPPMLVDDETKSARDMVSVYSSSGHGPEQTGGHPKCTVKKDEKAVSNMFELSHDDWDSDLDLSEVDCTTSPSWKPEVNTHPVSSTVAAENVSAAQEVTCPKSTALGGRKSPYVPNLPCTVSKNLSRSVVPTITAAVRNSALGSKLSDNPEHAEDIRTVSSCSNFPPRSSAAVTTEEPKFMNTTSELNIGSSAGDARTVKTSAQQHEIDGTGTGHPHAKPDSFKTPPPKSLLRPTFHSNTSPALVRPAYSVIHTPRASTSTNEASRLPDGTNHRSASTGPAVTPNMRGASAVKATSVRAATSVTMDMPGSGKSIIETPSSSKSSTGSSSKRKRKFPGPAGVLPRLKPGVSLDDMNMFKPASPRLPPGANKQEVPCTESQVASSQCFEERFVDGPWQLMKRDLEPQAQKILDEFCIAAILKKAIKKELPRSKVPVLCVSMDQVSLGSPEASVILRDPTGHMKGTVHRHVMTEHPDEMQVGTVLVLRQVGVFSPSGRNYYLNITPSNMVRMYTRSDCDLGVQTKTIATFSDADFKIPAAVPEAPQQLRPNALGTPRASPILRGRYTVGGFGHQQSPGGAVSRQLYPGSIRPRGASTPRFPAPIRSPYGRENNLPLPRSAMTRPNGVSPSSSYGVKSPMCFVQRPSSTPIACTSSESTVRTGLSVRQPNYQTPTASTSKFSFKKTPANPTSCTGAKMGTVAPSGGAISKQCSTFGGIQGGKANSNTSTSGPCAMNNQLRAPVADSSWHDDQLDDLLCDLGDDMLLDL